MGLNASVFAPAWQALALLPAVVIAWALRRRADAAADGAAMQHFVADHAGDLLTCHAPDGRIRFAGAASYALLGRLPAEMAGIGFAALAHPDDIKQVQGAFMACAYLGQAGSAQARLRHRSDAYVWTEIRCRPAGEGAGLVAVTRDISEWKMRETALIAARDAAESASHAKSDFLANMSHELRTPLNAIIGFSEIMARQMFGPITVPRYLEYAGLIQESGNHLLDLINGVLDMSKIEAGKFEIHEEMFDLGEEISAAMRFVAQQAERGGVALARDIAPGAARIFADRRAIRQILVNLLSNGVKFTPRGGAVTVSAAAVGEGVEILVRDTGTGIAKADLEKLGRPFQQGGGALGKEGTGLGLALVKSLAALHGGEAVLDSVLGEGTSVRLTLPHAAVGGGAARLEPARILPFRGAA